MAGIKIVKQLDPMAAGNAKHVRSLEERREVAEVRFSFSNEEKSWLCSVWYNSVKIELVAIEIPKEIDMSNKEGRLKMKALAHNEIKKGSKGTFDIDNKLMNWRKFYKYGKKEVKKA